MKKIYAILPFIFLGFQAFCQWNKLAPLGMGSATGCFNWVIGNRVFISGGTASKDLWEYDPVKNTWTDAGPMGGDMFHTSGMAFVLNGKGYVVGGDTAGASSTSAGVWEFDPAATTKWTYKGKFPGGPRKFATCFAINNKGYIAGGSDGTNVTTDFYSYDAVNNSWQPLTPWPQGMLFNTSTFVLNNKAYVCGGDLYIASQQNYEGRNWVWEFDATNKQWTKKKDMPADVIFGVGIGTQTSGFVIGGTGNFIQPAKNVWKYNATNDSWAIVSSYPTGNAWLLTGFAIDTTLYVGAGCDFSTGAAVLANDFYRYGAAPSSVLNLATADAIVKAYPNPCSSQLFISASSIYNGSVAILSDAAGREMKRTVLDKDGVASLDVQDVASGMYIISIAQGGKTYPGRIMIQH